MTAQVDARSDRRLDRLPTLLAPRSIALVGASDRSQWSTMVFGQPGGLQASSGQLPYPVNRRGGTVRGWPAATPCEQIGEQVDLAALMLPAPAVHDALRDVAAAGIENVVVIASGMGEGGEEGARRIERELVALVDELDLLMLGPNSLGMMNALDHTGAWFAPSPDTVLDGAMAIVSQSGAIGSCGESLCRFAPPPDSAISWPPGTRPGSTPSTSRASLLEDERVKAVAVFAEAIRQPDKLRAIGARALELGKGDRDAEGQGTSQLQCGTGDLTTPGALVGDDGVVDAALRGPASCGSTRSRT